MPKMTSLISGVTLMSVKIRKTSHSHSHLNLLKPRFGEETDLVLNGIWEFMIEAISQNFVQLRKLSDTSCFP
jgi:hypothetical protein